MMAKNILEDLKPEIFRKKSTIIVVYIIDFLLSHLENYFCGLCVLCLPATELGSERPSLLVLIDIFIRIRQCR